VSDFVDTIRNTPTALISIATIMRQVMGSLKSNHPKVIVTIGLT